MNFQELNELPSWVKTVATLIVGAGGSKLLAVWLENRRLEKKEYRHTLLGRIRELEAMVKDMQSSFVAMSVELALVKDENRELKEQLNNAQRRPQENETGG